MQARKGWSRGTWAAVVFAAGSWASPAAHASLSASSSACILTSSYGQLVSQNCVTGDNSSEGSNITLAGNTAMAVQAYGVFHGSAVSTNQGFAGIGEGGGSRAGANGLMRDVITITGGTGFGYLTFGWTITGATTLGFGGSTALLDMFASIGSRSEEFYITQAGQYAIARIPFTFGVPLDFIVSSTVTAASGYAEESFGHAYATYAAADFAHTSILTSIDAFDVNGRPIDGIGITAASGTRYPLSAAVTPPDDPAPPVNGVPEPATWVLLADGLVAVMLLRRGRKSARVRHDDDAMVFA